MIRDVKAPHGPSVLLQAGSRAVSIGVLSLLGGTASSFLPQPHQGNVPPHSRRGKHGTP